jgi:uncharacterized membrane protein YoaK (UPF0700 family)
MHLRFEHAGAMSAVQTPGAPARPFAPALPVVLSAEAGYVDTSSFLALQGLFTAHVTGNFVTLGASLAFGTTGVLAKLLAIPVFCAVVIGARVVGASLRDSGRPALPVLFTAKCLLLVLGGTLAILFGPFRSGDAWKAISTGMVLVAAMAIQNAAQRLYLSAAPPATMMTGSTTQLMIDLADLIRGGKEGRPAILARMRSISAIIAAFAVGCGAAAATFVAAGMWCFAIPPFLAAASVALARHDVRHSLHHAPEDQP